MSRYLSLEVVKKHLNIDYNYGVDDLYLEGLMDTAELVVEKYIDNPLENLEDDDNMIPAPVMHAMLLLIGTYYNTRESVETMTMTPVPHSFDLLCDLYRDYKINKSEDE